METFERVIEAGIAYGRFVFKMRGSKVVLNFPHEAGNLLCSEPTVMFIRKKAKRV